MNSEANFKEQFVSTRHIAVPGKIVSKARARQGKHGFYTPSQTTNSEIEIKHAYHTKYGKYGLIEGPIKLRIIIYKLIPKSFSKKKTEQALSGKLYPTVKPDIDNVAKLVMDALNKEWRSFQVPSYSMLAQDATGQRSLSCQ